MTFLLRWLLGLSVAKRQVFQVSILESRNLTFSCKTVSPRSIPLDSGDGEPWHSSVHVARLGPTQLLRASSTEKDILQFLVHRVDAFDLDQLNWEGAQLKRIFALTQLERLRQLGWIGYHTLLAPNIVYVGDKAIQDVGSLRLWKVGFLCTVPAPPAFYTFLSSQLGPPVNVM